MCGRLVLSQGDDELADLFGVRADLQLAPRYNIAPTQPIVVVRNDPRGQREIVRMRWGLIPRWSTEVNPVGFINARSETVAEKPAFRNAFRSRRCLVPADGFYEWKATGRKHKQPFFFRPRGGGLFAFAGLWETWSGPRGLVDTVAILTTSANDLVQPLHDRMPVIVPPEQFDSWLDPRATETERLQSLLGPYPSERMECWPVSERVNSAQVEEPHLNAPLPTPSSGSQPSLF